MAIPVFTTNVFNQNLLQPVGAIFVQRVESVSVARDFMAGLGAIVGGQSKTMEKKMNDLTAAVLQELQTQTKAKYPNAVAIVGVDVDFSVIGQTNDFIAAQARGTVLVKRGASGQGGPVASSTPLAVGGRRRKARKTRRRR
jgi:uncharacterized protein YbjQ (UPF0145 family)